VKRLVGALAALACLLISGGCGINFGGGNGGRIEFGSSFQKTSGQDITIVNPHSRFHLSQNVAWVAHLSQAAGSRTLTLSILRHGRRDTPLFGTPITIRHVNPHWNALASGVPARYFLSLHATAPGTYILKYSRGSKILAQGSFKLLP